MILYILLCSLCPTPLHSSCLISGTGSGGASETGSRRSRSSGSEQSGSTAAAAASVGSGGGSGGAGSGAGGRQLQYVPEELSASRQSFRMAMGNPCEFFVDVM